MTKLSISDEEIIMDISQKLHSFTSELKSDPEIDDYLIESANLHLGMCLDLLDKAMKGRAMRKQK